MSTRSLLLAAALLLPACGWDSTPDEDAGDAAWVMATVPTLLGRHHERRRALALTSIAQTSGRETVVDVLLERPEFSRYWALALLDHQQLDLGLHRVQSDCLYPEDEAPSPQALRSLALRRHGRHTGRHHRGRHREGLRRQRVHRRPRHVQPGCALQPPAGSSHRGRPPRRRLVGLHPSARVVPCHRCVRISRRGSAATRADRPLHTAGAQP